MNRPVSTSAFSGANDHLAAIEEWRAKTDEHGHNVKRLNSKIVGHKKASASSSRKLQWLRDRDALSEEQDQCEEQLQTALARLRHLVGVDVDLAAETELLKDEIRSTLRTLREAKRQHQTSRDSRSVYEMADVIHEHYVQANEFLSAEQEKTNDLFEFLRCATATDGDADGASDVVDFDSLFAHSAKRLDELCLPDGAQAEEIQALYASALQHEQQKTLSRISGYSLPPIAASIPEQTIRTVLLIIKMAERARINDVTAASTAEVRERVAASFPGLALRDRNTAIDQALAIRQNQALLHAAAKDYRRVTEALLASCAEALAANREMATLFAIQGAESMEREAEQQERHAALERSRGEYLQRQQQRQEEEAERAREEAARKARVQARLLAEFQGRLEELTIYEAKKAEIMKKEAHLRELKAEEEKAQREVRMEENGRRVVFRQGRYEERLAARKAEEEALVALRREKDEALQRFYDAVEKKVGVASDPNRLLLPTVSTAQVTPFTAQAEAAQQQFGAVGGYSDEQIMRDPRVRLFHALYEAGLHTTPYGREVVTRGYHVPTAQQTSEANPFRGDFM